MAFVRHGADGGHVLSFTGNSGMLLFRRSFDKIKPAALQGARQVFPSAILAKLDKPKYEVVVVDYGVKRNILRALAHVGARATVVPANTSAEDILARNPDGVMLSNGPGDPAATGQYSVPEIQKLVASGKPIFGICLGHQMLGHGSQRPATLNPARSRISRRACSKPVMVVQRHPNHGRIRARGQEADSNPAGMATESWASRSVTSTSTVRRRSAVPR
jgi:hypothetical protein